MFKVVYELTQRTYAKLCYVIIELKIAKKEKIIDMKLRMSKSCETLINLCFKIIL